MRKAILGIAGVAVVVGCAWILLRQQAVEDPKPSDAAVDLESPDSPTSLRGHAREAARLPSEPVPAQVPAASPIKPPGEDVDSLDASGEGWRILALRQTAVADAKFWDTLKEKGAHEAIIYLEEGILAGPHTPAWLRANAVAMTVGARHLDPWEALQAVIDAFARARSVAIPPKGRPDPGHAIWRDSLQTDHGGDSIEFALHDAMRAFDHRPSDRDYSDHLAGLILRLAAKLSDAQRADPAVHTLVEFVRLNAAIAYSIDTHREGSAAIARRLLPRIRTFIEADRGAATDRVKPMVDWMRNWYPDAVRARAEDSPESTPVPDLRAPPDDESLFALPK